jgi:hypothetical protein
VRDVRHTARLSARPCDQRVWRGRHGDAFQDAGTRCASTHCRQCRLLSSTACAAGETDEHRITRCNPQRIIQVQNSHLLLVIYRVQYIHVHVWPKCSIAIHKSILCVRDGMISSCACFEAIKSACVCMLAPNVCSSSCADVQLHTACIVRVRVRGQSVVLYDGFAVVRKHCVWLFLRTHQN